MPPLVAFSDVDLDLVVTFASPIESEARGEFLQDVAALVHQSHELGRACAGAQRRHWPPGPAS